MARRGFGKASFLRLRDGSGEIQLFAKKDIMGASFDALDDVDIADHVEVRGRAMVTKTGELSLELSDLKLVTKAFRPPPDKWHGLTNVDLRYRQRYVDFVANPDAAGGHARPLDHRPGLRDFLDRRDFLEVETPTLRTLDRRRGCEAVRDAPQRARHEALHAHRAGALLEALARGRLRARATRSAAAYRNEGLSTRRNPEFTILEFYQAYATYETLLALTESSSATWTRS